jgi:hypothetical protein
MKQKSPKNIQIDLQRSYYHVKASHVYTSMLHVQHLHNVTQKEYTNWFATVLSCESQSCLCVTCIIHIQGAPVGLHKLICSSLIICICCMYNIYTGCPRRNTQIDLQRSYHLYMLHVQQIYRVSQEEYTDWFATVLSYESQSCLYVACVTHVQVSQEERSVSW